MNGAVTCSDRVRAIEESATFALFDLVDHLRAQGKPILDLGGGEPDFDTPQHVRQAAQSALDEGWTHYTPSRGYADLRQAIADKLRRDNDIVVDPGSEVIVTPSAKHALFITLAALLDPGDEVIVPTPAWISYQAMVRLAGGVVVDLPLDASSGFEITPQQLAACVSPRTKAIVLNSPNNPTGHVIGYREAIGIAAFAQEHGLAIISDEIYERIVFGGKQHFSFASLAQVRDRTLTINGFSKAHAMTGWRLGYVAGPEPLMAQILKVQQHTVGCAASFPQRGALAALCGTPTPVHAMVSSYAQRRAALLAGLDGIAGLRCVEPEGAFYAWLDIREAGLGDAASFSQWLLSSAGVVATPGTAFGAAGEGHVRLSFAASMEVIEQATRAIRLAMHQQRQGRSTC